ncbi:MAG TPA: CHAT domain-containing protein, partial [Chthonomonadales bacterium]|nr:CHAT domain-containing protein [Chthonomonadales bacterium]
FSLPPERSADDGWELPLGLNPRINFSRSPRIARPPSQMRSRSARMLVAWADPQSPEFGALPHLTQELTGLRDALSGAKRRRLDTEFLPLASSDGLRRMLLAYRPTLLHFIGHGVNTATGGALVMHGAGPREGRLLYADELAEWVQEAGVSVVVLSACPAGGRAGALAAGLSESGTPAVIAMQLPWRDAAASHFTSALYNSLLAGTTIQIATRMAREAISTYGPDWGAPVLYLTREDGRLFDLMRGPGRSAPPPNNLPADDHQFVGRKRETARLKKLLLSKRTRLVTVTGMGGMGKSSLALHTARQLANRFPDGARLVDCRGGESREQLAAAILSVIDAPAREDRPEPALLEAAASRSMLLLLDGFEHSLRHADLLDTLLASAGSLKCLVTSRVALGLKRETQMALEPMPIDGSEVGAPLESAALFLETAKRVRPELNQTPANLELVRSLCAELHGLPLLIVLAASRLSAMSLSELLEQLRLRPLLVLRSAGEEDRHASVQRVIADSLLILPPASRRLLYEMSVFEGGCTLDAAESVCTADCSGHVLDGLQLLRNHSLLTLQENEQRTRYKVADPIREYLEEDPGYPPEPCRNRHAEYFARYALTSDAEFQRGDWLAGANHLWLEMANFRAAMAFAFHGGRHELVAAFAEALARMLFESGLWDDFTALALAADAASVALDLPKLRAQMLALRGALCLRKADNAGARRMWRARLALSRQIRDDGSVIDALCDLAQLAHLDGDPGAALKLMQSAAARAKRAADPRPMAQCLAVTAEFAISAGDPEPATTAAREACSLLQDFADCEAMIYTNRALGRALRLGRDYAESESALVEMLQVAHASHRTFDVSDALLELGKTYEQWFKLDLAHMAYTAAARMHRDLSCARRERTRVELERFERSIGGMAVSSPQDENSTLSWRRIAANILGTSEPTA